MKRLVSVLATVSALSLTSTFSPIVHAGTNETLIKDSQLGPGYYSQSTINNAKAMYATADATPIRGIVTINYVPGYGVALWSVPGTELTGKYLPTGSKWQMFSYVTINGQRWYDLGGGQWLSAKYAIVSGKNFDSVNNNYGVVKISSNMSGDIYNAIGGSKTDRKLATNTSWKYFKTAKYQGSTWYNLGGNQWISNQNINNNDSGILDEQGTVRIIPDTTGIVYDAIDGNSTGKKLPANTSWKFFKMATYQRQNWYNLGGNQWLPEKYVHLTGEPENVVIEVNTIATVNTAAGIPVLDAPSGKATGQVLPNGSKWKVSAELNNGLLWYEVGNHQWIQALNTY